MTTPEPSTFGAYLRANRDRCGFSARHVARETGTTTTTITRFEEETYHVPNPELLLKLVDVLGLDVLTALTLIEPYRLLLDRILTHDTNQGTTP